MNLSPPTLSLKERDRRWSHIKRLMDLHNIDCLIVPGLNGREQYESYLSNDYVQGIVIFPMEGEPTYIAWITGRIIRHMQDSAAGMAPWIDDWRVGASGNKVVEVLQEKGLDASHIGVVGIESWSAGETEGYIPHKTWEYILEHLPGAKFTDISQEFAELVFVKSDEELELVRYSARVGEMACQRMLEMVKPGISETEIYTGIMSVIFGNGCGTISPHLILTTGVGNTSWGPPPWIYQARPPRILEKGDIIMAELFPCYGGYENQIQMAIAMEPVQTVNKECADVARRSYEVGLKALSPGKTFQEVADAMEVPLTEAGCWHLTPLIHSLSPLNWVGYMNVGINDLPGISKYPGIGPVPVRGGDLVIKPGMVFELEPNACKGPHRINIGGAVIVREDGVEELNTLPTRMQVMA